MSVCYHCGEILPEGKIGRTWECRRCGRPLHVCRNCLYYDVSVSGRCREDAAETVSDKERANFCDYFRPGEIAFQKAEPADETRRRFDSLFGKESL